MQIIIPLQLLTSTLLLSKRYGRGHYAGAALILCGLCVTALPSVWHNAVNGPQSFTIMTTQQAPPPFASSAPLPGPLANIWRQSRSLLNGKWRVDEERLKKDSLPWRTSEGSTDGNVALNEALNENYDSQHTFVLPYGTVWPDSTAADALNADKIPAAQVADGFEGSRWWRSNERDESGEVPPRGVHRLTANDRDPTLQPRQHAANSPPLAEAGRHVEVRIEDLVDSAEAERHAEALMRATWLYLLAGVPWVASTVSKDFVLSTSPINAQSLNMTLSVFQLLWSLLFLPFALAIQRFLDTSLSADAFTPADTRSLFRGAVACLLHGRSVTAKQLDDCHTARYYTAALIFAHFISSTCLLFFVQTVSAPSRFLSWTTSYGALAAFVVLLIVRPSDPFSWLLGVACFSVFVGLGVLRLLGDPEADAAELALEGAPPFEECQNIAPAAAGYRKLSTSTAAGVVSNGGAPQLFRGGGGCGESSHLSTAVARAPGEWPTASRRAAHATAAANCPTAVKRHRCGLMPMVVASCNNAQTIHNHSRIAAGGDAQQKLPLAPDGRPPHGVVVPVVGHLYPQGFRDCQNEKV